MARALLLLNPGARRVNQSREEIVSRLAALGLDPLVEVTQEPAKVAEQLLRHRDEVDRIVVGGGDGTLHLALQGLVESGHPLGIIPLGTANNLARTLGIPTDLEQACHLVAHGQRRRIDLGWMNGRYFFTTASLGLSVRITEQLSAESKRRWGPIAYALTALRIIRRIPPFHADISWAGGSRRSRTVQIVVGNGRYYGKALPVAEDARIDDAQLDLYSLEIRRWWELILLTPALMRGRHGERPTVEALKATEFEIRTRVPHDVDLDGEIGGQTPATIRVCRAALEVFVPT